MGMGFRLNLKWDFPINCPTLTNSPSRLCTSSVQGKEASFDLTRFSFPSVTSEDCETLYKDPFKPFACSSGAIQTFENDYSEMEEMKMKIGKCSHGDLFKIVNASQAPIGEDVSASVAGLQASKASQFSLLLENLDILEEMFADSNMLVANLERIRATLEEESGHVASLSNWAEAAGVDKKVLQQQLQFGWYCRDELLRSTHSLVLYIARNYRGMGVAFEDILQAGNLGVLQGAERFDHTKGFRFSTYVQYWIRKSMSTLVARHARGVKIPFTLNRAIGQIQKARKALYKSHGRYPDDNEIAKFTGLSLAKIRSAGNCLRVVGSTDQSFQDCWGATILEFTPDTSIKSPEEGFMQQCKRKDIHNLLKGLDPRERQILVLRYGFGEQQRKSLEEIGRLFNVSKEWIRKLEKTALAKLRDEEICQNLRHYVDV
ncbi:hypothetical protein PVL29_003915 [Vitis rotundifolia]|uniref:Uncharacterized protein n=1 Tax=Vitis rotundifolia TaxID=103349 RepID=A0AA39A7I8_VITRO|nr:hypothetical protein PVL29_003915 [Vitis rotundifolia]